MADFIDLLRSNRNYRSTWMGQVVSEIGDYFNNIAVFSLVMQTSGSGLVVSGVMLARAIPAGRAPILPADGRGSSRRLAGKFRLTPACTHSCVGLGGSLPYDRGSVHVAEPRP